MYYKMSDLLNLALASPKIGMINCFMLHTLLHAIIKRLDIGDTRVKVPERPDEVVIPLQKEPVHKEIKTGEAGHRSTHGILTDIQRQPQPEIAAQTDETMTTDSFKPTDKQVKIGSEIELSVTALPKLTISRQSSIQELVKDFDEELSETEFRSLRSSSKVSIHSASEGTVDYPSRYYSIDGINETTICGIPYVESQINDLLNKLNHFPPVESMEKLFELLENHSLSRKEEVEKVMNAKAEFLKNVGAILDKIQLMDVRLKKFESITFVYNIEEIISKLHSLDMKLEELQNASLLKSLGDIMNKILILSDKQEEIIHRLEKAEDDIAILEVFMKQLEVMELEKQKQKGEQGGSLVQFDLGSTSKSVLSIDLQRQNSQEQKLTHRLFQLENELSDIKSYLFKKRRPSQVSYLTPSTSPYAQTSSKEIITTEDQLDELNKHMERFLRRTSMSASQNIYNLTEQIETLHENIKNLSINIKSLETAKGFLEQNVQQLWKEIKHLQEMIAEDVDVLNRLTVAERKLDLKIEILEENVNLLNVDNKRLKNAISNIELEKFSKSTITLNADQDPSKIKCISALTPHEVNQVTKELEKRIEEQKKYFTNQLQFINQLLSSKSDRWELEWFQIWLEKSLKTHLKTSKHSKGFEIDEAFAMKRKLCPDKCLSCNRPIARKHQHQAPSGKDCNIQIQKEHLAHKNSEKRNTVLNSNITQHEIWLEGRDGRLYKGSEDFAITVNPHIYRQQNEQVATKFVKTPEICESNVSPNTVSRTVPTEKDSVPPQPSKEALLLHEHLQVHAPTKRAQSLTAMAELNENSEVKPGKTSIYASTSQIENVQKLTLDNLKDTDFDKKEVGVGGN
eukprot:XP_014789688.1 PREDICTED: kinesin-related protein 4-like isoform X2 [Octopus bimaculoides]